MKSMTEEIGHARFTRNGCGFDPSRFTTGTPNGTGPFSRVPILPEMNMTEPKTERVHAAVTKERRKQLAAICFERLSTESQVIDDLIREEAERMEAK